MTAPAAEGVRVPYDEAPADLRAWVDSELGSPVVAALTQTGGFSPGVAARLRCADGRRAFCKAVTDVNAFAADSHRREQRITAALPAAVPAPRLLASYDDGRWVALLLADIDGRQPALPWVDAELRRVIAATDEMAALLTPCPLPGAPLIVAEWGEDFDQWRTCAATGPPAGLDDWSHRHLDRLATLEPEWEAAAVGDTLLHLDLRADNLLLTADRVWVVDWTRRSGRGPVRPGGDGTERGHAGRARPEHAVVTERDRPWRGPRRAGSVGVRPRGLLRRHGACAPAAGIADRARIPGCPGRGRRTLAGRAHRVGVIWPRTRPD
jgi:hypothetical protein